MLSMLGKIYLNSNRRKRAMFLNTEIVGGEGLSKSTVKVGSSIMMAMAVFALVVSVLWI
jgi:hypothetical protein